MQNVKKGDEKSPTLFSVLALTAKKDPRQPFGNGVRSTFKDRDGILTTADSRTLARLENCPTRLAHNVTRHVIKIEVESSYHPLFGIKLWPLSTPRTELRQRPLKFGSNSQVTAYDLLDFLKVTHTLFGSGVGSSTRVHSPH